MRTVDELIESSMRVIHRAECAKPWGTIEPLFSGGHDSLCATHLASQHKRFSGVVHHIDTGIGANYTRRFVDSVCDAQGWKLVVHKSQDTYEQYVSEIGMPGPGRHQHVYNRIKDRCVYQITSRHARLLITGCRQQESVRRMGHAVAVQVGEISEKTGRVRNKARVWTAPCFDWSKAEQQLYMDEMGLPTNKLKVAVGLSGECFCGAFAATGERELIREHAPDVDEKISRAEAIAASRGLPCIWGVRPTEKVVVHRTGMMCSGCDQRAASLGITVIGACNASR